MFLSAFDLKVVSYLRRSKLEILDRRSRIFFGGKFKWQMTWKNTACKCVRFASREIENCSFQLTLLMPSWYRAILLAVIFDYTTRIDQSVKWNTVQTKVRLCVLHRDQLHFASGTNGWTHKREIQRIDPQCTQKFAFPGRKMMLHFIAVEEKKFGEVGRGLSLAGRTGQQDYVVPQDKLSRTGPDFFSDTKNFIFFLANNF